MGMTEEMLGWENRRNKQANINDDICSLFQLVFILWENCADTIVCLCIDSHTCESACNFTCAKVTKLALHFLY